HGGGPAGPRVGSGLAESVEPLWRLDLDPLSSTEGVASKPASEARSRLGWSVIGARVFSYERDPGADPRRSSGFDGALLEGDAPCGRERFCRELFLTSRQLL